MKFARPIFLFLFLTSCQQATTPLPVQRPNAPDTCGAAPYARLIGMSSTALERELIMRQVRTIRPGQAVTMEYSETRLNFEIGSEERIARVFCG